MKYKRVEIQEKDPRDVRGKASEMRYLKRAALPKAM
jgi:hypothetical protein